MTHKTQPTAHAEITAPISADLRGIEQEARELPEPSPTAGMNLGQRILHVGGRENAAGYIEFGSVAAVRALVGQVLRDMQAAPPAPAAVAVPESREAEIRDVCNLIGHFGLLIQQGEASGALEQLDLIKTRLRAALAAAPAQPAAWMTPEGDRVVTEATMASARKDGGAMLSSLRPFTVALARLAAPAQAVAVPADAQAPEQWIDDPHDIEQGRMLNPEWVRAQEHATQVAGQGLAIMGKSHISPAAPARAHEDARDTKIASLTKAYTELSNIFHDQVVAQQAAWIEWQHGGGAEVAMGWIENGLCGPGHIPDEGAPYGKDAQAWYDANNSDPFPACQCGRPSNIMWMGMGFCCKAHHDAARAAQGGA